MLNLRNLIPQRLKSEKQKGTPYKQSALKIGDKIISLCRESRPWQLWLRGTSQLAWL